MKNLAILGAGGHGKIAADIAEQLGWQIHFFDAAYPEIKTCGAWDVVGDEICLIEHAAKYDAVFVAIGSNDIRAIKQEELKAYGFRITSLISPSATISGYVDIGDGVLIVANACINVGASIGDGVIINTGANIDHDNVIGNYSHISPGVNLAGNVSIGQRCWIGIGSTVIHQIKVSDNVMVGAGAVIVNDVPANVTLVGCPARIVRKH